jgi:CDP-glucose 4,6-dehydratase
VIGGGDWAADRLVPDFVRAVLNNKKIMIRNPKAVRPWQYVLEPLAGYLLLAEKLYKYGNEYAGAYNFGPAEKDDRSVEWIINNLCAMWGGKASYSVKKGKHPHETSYLRLDNLKAKKELNWRPKWELKTSLKKVIEWTKAYQNKKDIRSVCLSQIKEYTDG